MSPTTMIAIAACLLAAGCNANPQASAGSLSAASVKTDAAQVAHPGMLKPGDVLEIRCWPLFDGSGDTSIVQHVAADGTISPPYLSPTRVAGLAAGDAQDVLVGAYREANIEQNMMVYIRRLVVGSNGLPVNDVIGNFDLVRLSIFGLIQPGVESVRISRIQGDGTLFIPYLGQVKLAGLTESRAEQAITIAFRDANVEGYGPVMVFILEPAPPDAASRDLPDIAINPIPPGMAPFFDDTPVARPAVPATPKIKK